MINHDILIVGGGLTGLRAAVGLCDRFNVGLVSKVYPIRSHSIAAQGGINAALANNPDSRDDSWEKHTFDTIKGSDYLADQDAVEIMCKEAIADRLRDGALGLPLQPVSRRHHRPAPLRRRRLSPDLLLRRHHRPRAAQHPLRTGRRQGGQDLLRNGSWPPCASTRAGATASSSWTCSTGELIPVGAGATFFGTGGYGRVFQHSTNALINTGSGIGMAYAAGVPLKDMEFVQFHPTSLIGTNILMTEGCRGEGGYLVNNQGERFMQRYAPKAMELAPRDIVSRCIQTEINEGRGFEHPLGKYIQLDLRHLGEKKILERLPGIRKICIDFVGVDPVDEPIPIMPCQHYSMGGIDVEQAVRLRSPGLLRRRRMRLRQRPRRQPPGRQLASGDDRLREAGGAGDRRGSWRAARAGPTRRPS